MKPRQPTRQGKGAKSGGSVSQDEGVNRLCDAPPCAERFFILPSSVIDSCYNQKGSMYYGKATVYL